MLARIAKYAAMWLLEFVLLVGLWELYVSNPHLSDLLVGIGRRPGRHRG